MRWRSQIKCIGIATLLIGSTIIALTVWSTEEVWAASSSSLPLLTRLVAPTPTPTPTPSQPGIFSVIDPNIVGTIFGVLGTLGTFIAIGISNRQHRETQQAEQKRQEAEERRQEDQKKHQRELVDVQKQHQIEIEQERIRLTREMMAQEEEEKRKGQEDQIRRELMERASSIEERAFIYQELFRDDPDISDVHILGMTRPLKVLDVFVPMRVRSDDKYHAELDQSLHETEHQHDLEIFMQKRFRDAHDPVQAIRQHSRCVLLGDPGAGKTTLLKYLALNTIANKLTGLPNLPIYIDLNKYVGSPYHDLLEFAAHQWELEYSFPQADAHSYMTSNLNDGKALLLLDALDETLIGTTAEEAEASYKQVANDILKLSKRFNKSPVVVTARKAGYKQRNMITGFAQFEILEFRPEDITRFINHWFSATEKLQRRSKASDLKRRLERHPRLHTIASNPLLLSLIVMFYEAYNTLPEGRAELYQRCAETLLAEWVARHDTPLRSELGKDHKQQLLREIAWHFLIRKKHSFPEDELLKVIHSFLLTINQPGELSHLILREITTINGLLKPQAWHLYGFLHLSFQEYFAAEYVLVYHREDELLKYVGDPSWEEVIRLYASRVPDASPLLQKLLYQGHEQKLQEDIFHTNLLLAGHCLVDHPRIQQLSLRDEITSRLFDVLTSTRYALTKEQIVYILTTIGDKDINARLLQLLIDEHTDHDLRWKIAETFGTVGEQSIAFELLPLLSNTNIDASVREAIAEACGKLGNQAVAYTLLRLLDTASPERNLYQSIVLALGTLGETQVIPSLLERLEKPSIDVGLRCSIAEALALLDDKTIIHKLLILLAQKDMNQRVRCAIADTLGIIGDSSTTAPLLDLLTREVVNNIVRYHIAYALGRLGEQSIIPRLQNLRTQTNPQLSRCITIALGMLGEPTVIPDLLNMLKDTNTDRYILQVIPNVLSMLGDQSIQRQLLPLLSDTNIDPGIRSGIANALGKLGNFSICHELLDILAQERIDLSVRRCLAITVGKLGNCSIASALLDMIDNTQINQYVRMSIAEALTVLGECPIAHRLVALLFNEHIEHNIRESIAKALIYIANDYNTVELLARHLQNTDIPEQIFSVLRSISRRSRARIFLSHESNDMQIIPICYSLPTETSKN